MADIRSPILVNLGHVDHGKTTLLDRIRGTAIAKGEAGLITQYISASYIPTEIIKKVSGPLLEKLGIELTIPGLLWIDSPGHEAFTTLRKRGGAIADLAVLVIDINEGFRPQTHESLNFLKQFKTPFVVALTKIDRITGWNPQHGQCFLTSLKEQTQRAVEEFEEKFYRVAGQLTEQGFSADRYDRISDYSKQVALVPVCSATGEGIPDLLMILAGIAQKYLKKGLEITKGEGKGTVLEVKEFKGLGITIDVVLYDGELRRGDYLVIGNTDDGALVTRVKALLEPKALKELRSEKDFIQKDRIIAAAGIKIAAPNLEKVIAGSPLRALANQEGLERAQKEVSQEIEEVEFESDITGAIVKADTLGSLEALIKTLRDLNIPIRKAHVGNVIKSDIMEVKLSKSPLIFVFGLKPSPEMAKLAKDNGVMVFESNIIYALVERYKEWVKERQQLNEEAILQTTPRPGRIKVLKGYVFRQSKPAVFGVDVVKGIIKPGYKLTKNHSIIGTIREIQLQGENVKEARKGERVAVSMDGVTVGKDINENDILDVYLSEKNIRELAQVRAKLEQDERELLDEEEHA